ncbi:MAG TPA: hypothetical protein VN026_04605 [Bacteroidia bacterium]|nr:hypothetical protein [Bacteroidia bacterium]
MRKLLLPLLLLFSCSEPSHKQSKDDLQQSARIKVEVFLENKDYLKDPSSYEAISWGNLTDCSMGDVIEVRIPHIRSGKVYDDSTHLNESKIASPFNDDVTDKVKLFVIHKKDGWIRYRTSVDKIAKYGKPFPSFWCKEKDTKIDPREKKLDPMIKYTLYHKFRFKNGFGGMEIAEETFLFDKDVNLIGINN